MIMMGDMALTAQAPALIPESPSDALARVSTTKMNRPKRLPKKWQRAACASTATSTVKNTISRIKVSLAMGAHKNLMAVGPEGASPNKNPRFLGNTISDAQIL